MTVPDPRTFRPTRVPEHERVEIHEYDPEWPEYFRVSAGLLRGLLGPHVGRIEHFGSTSVPGLAAKPIIDMLVEVPSAETADTIVMPRLVWGGMEGYWQTDERYWFFIQRHPVRPHRTHHIHVAPPGHEVWSRLAVRDHLRSHPEEAVRYADLKRRLAADHTYDREAYTEAKTDYITALTRSIAPLRGS